MGIESEGLFKLSWFISYDFKKLTPIWAPSPEF